jgi:HPt (histidine-containing phosphotransfer) domain-containing protein
MSTPSSQPPHIDQSRAMDYFGDAKFINKLFQTLAQTLPEGLLSIETALTNLDGELAGKTLHQLKGFLPLVIDETSNHMLLQAEALLTRNPEKIKEAEHTQSLQALLVRLKTIQSQLLAELGALND